MKGRVIVGVALLTVWLGAMGFHVKREYFRADAVVMALGAQRLAPNSYFYTVELEGRAIGMASSRLDTVPDGFIFEDLLQLEVPALDTFHPATVRTRARLGRSLELMDFEFRLESGIGVYDVRGVARGDSVIELRLNAGGGEQVSTVRLGAGTTLAAALPLRMAAAGRLSSGGQFAARVLDPSTLADRAVSVRVRGRDMVEVADSAIRHERSGIWRPAGRSELAAWVVEESYGGVTVTSWLDQEGRLLKAESPMGFTLRRTAYELAEQAWKRARDHPDQARGYGAVIESTAIAANAELGGTEGLLESMTVRLRNVELHGFDLDGGRQTLRGDTLTVLREPGAALAARYTLPYSGGGDPADELNATPLIQSDDPRIVAMARQIADGETTPQVVARRLTDWVYGALEKEVTLSIPSALQVLEARQGDCNEHTVLYVALARALGLPARTAVGIVHLNGRFYYHAWPEVWLDEWVAVDPTLDQYPADASHIRFLVGGLARQVELIRLIGRLELDIIRTNI